MLADAGHVLMQTRTGLVADARLTRAGGTAEREAALTLLDRPRRAKRITFAAASRPS